MDIGYKLKEENPEKKSNIFSKLFYGWLATLIRNGVKKGNFELLDLYKANEKDKSKDVTEILEKHWQNEVLRTKTKKCKPSLLRAICKTFLLEYMMYGLVWCFANVVLLCSKPVLLAELIEVFTDTTGADRTSEMYIYSAALLGVTILTIFCFHHTNFWSNQIGMRVRVATSALVYRKITRLNQKALGETAAGEVVNLLSNDVNRFDFVVVPLHALWVMPFQVAVIMYIIWNQVGISCLAGVLSMAIISLPIQGYFGKLLGDIRTKVSKKTDTRVKLMSEVVFGIQVIKMYAWEKPFEKVIKFARASEIKDITKASYLRGVFSSCMVFCDRLSLFLTVICYVLLGNHISADIIFSLTQSYNILQTAMAIWYPMAISLGAETLVSIERLRDFLLLEEKEEANIEKLKKTEIILKNVNASWTSKGNTLQDLSFQIPSGTLCAIVGPVGAGKSSLLQLLLGELPASSGKVQIGGEISYSSQEAWLFQSTVRNNILFGQTFNKRWYDKVVKVCALERDFEQFPQSDRTIVGEKGVSLSGGQRARINLARAIYRHADIYLMDDPLSAVDTHVGRHLFDQCIHQHLRGKTRIIVTHQLQYLKKADLIIVLNNGKIEAQGTFQELSNSKLDFTRMLVAADETVEKDDEEMDELPPALTKKFSGVSMRRFSVLSSTNSEISENIEFVDENDIDEEESGNDPNSSPFKDYITANRNLFLLILLISMLIIAQALCAGVDLFVTIWTSQEEARQINGSVVLSPSSAEPEIHIIPLNKTNSITDSHTYSYVLNPDPSSSIFDSIYDYIEVRGEVQKLLKTDAAMYIYGALIISAVILTFTRSMLFFKMCMMSSVNLHSSIFHTLLKAPMRFFDTNPSGRILNRFSKDMGAIDETLPRVLLEAIQIFLVMAGILINIAISNYYLIIPMVIVGFVFFKFRTWYIFTAKGLKHLEGITKSPVFSHVNSTLNGITTIRARKAEVILTEEFDNHQDVHTSAWYLTIACVSSFGLWLDILSAIFLASVTGIFVIYKTYAEVNGSMAGLAISQCLVLTFMLQYGMKQTAEVINQLTSVERVNQYTKLDTEGPFETPKEKLPKAPWPREGLVEFKSLSLRYIETDPPVLNSLNIKILPGEKIGIVGRTGAGKSSLIAALFRLAHLEGTILIDAIPTKDIGLTDLRRKISIIPQEPVLFSATLRYNLDPFGEFSDQDIWKALDQVELKDSIDSLEFMVAEGGGNFSLGQRQLVCLARAALKNNKILVLDEATANVDPRTDALIQATIRKRFKDCTVITIAHRLNTIMDSDKVLVMSFGNMVEFDHPHQLLQIPDGYFVKMVLETGPTMSLQLKDIAMEAYKKSEIKEEGRID